MRCRGIELSAVSQVISGFLVCSLILLTTLLTTSVCRYWSKTWGHLSRNYSRARTVPLTASIPVQKLAFHGVIFDVRFYKVLTCPKTYFVLVKKLTLIAVSLSGRPFLFAYVPTLTHRPATLICSWCMTRLSYNHRHSMPFAVPARFHQVCCPS